MSKLTQKQENFVQALVSGKSQREAYKEAYNAANMKDSTVDSNACRLLNNSKVAARYNELKAIEEERQREKYSLDRDKALENYLWLMNEAKETIEACGIRQATANAYINSLDKACNLLDLYPDKKQSVKLSGDLTTTNTNPLEGFTYEEMKDWLDKYDKR